MGAEYSVVGVDLRRCRPMLKPVPLEYSRVCADQRLCSPSCRPDRSAPNRGPRTSPSIDTAASQVARISLRPRDRTTRSGTALADPSRRGVQPVSIAGLVPLLGGLCEGAEELGAALSADAVGSSGGVVLEDSAMR